MDAIGIITGTFSLQTNNGACGRVARIRDIIRPLVEITPGNIVEIGCGVGQSSVYFLEAARDFNRRFVAVDPWGDSYKSNGKANGYTFAEFSKSVDIMSPHIVVCRTESGDPEAIKTILAYASYAFGFVDGDVFSVKSVLGDMQTLAGCGTSIICVDDQAQEFVRPAINEFKKDWQYDEYFAEGMLETYLVRRV